MGCREHVEEQREYLRKHTYCTQRVPLRIARDLVEAHHYARGSSHSAVLSMGVVHRASGDVVAAALVCMGGSPAVAKWGARQFKGGTPTNVCVLSRMVVAPCVPKGGASFLLGGTLRTLREEGRFVGILAWADGLEGHTGQIYTDCGWTPLGISPSRRRWITSAGAQVSKRSTRNRTALEMRALGHTCIPGKPKPRFGKSLNRRYPLLGEN
jgi:hypothetical protein